MREEKRLPLAVLGGDLRQCALCAMLSEKGYRIKSFGLEKAGELKGEKCASIRQAAQGAYAFVLPIPLEREERYLNAPLAVEQLKTEYALSFLPKDALVFSGAIRQKTQEMMEQSGLRVIDCLSKEDVVMTNADITAECAIGLAMAETQKTLNGSSVLIVGNGRIGKFLAYKLRALGARVAVSARKERDFAYIEAMGGKALHTQGLTDNLKGFDVIFNTVPHLVLDRQQLAGMDMDALVIDLASAPGGVNFTAAKEAGIRAIHALALPGKMAPWSSAQAIMKAIVSTLNKEEEV